MHASGKRALVAEDNAALCRVISLTLRKVGLVVTTCRDGAEAWDRAQEEVFDLVVTDQQMPEMTGLELIERLKGCESNRDAPIVLLTAKGMELEQERLRDEYGVDALLTKPFSPTHLSQLAEQLLVAVA